LYIMEMAMQVAKWGNSLAIRLPKDVVKRMGLKEGDQVDITSDGEHGLRMQRRMTREEAVQALWEHHRPLPTGFKFDRDDANER
jgi:antitoxin MazE